MSLPVLFCMTKGKNKDTYVKLLGLVEELATEAGVTIFNREVQLMCDFELAFINTVQQLYSLVKVKCCFFHYTQSIRKRATEAITAVTKAACENTEKVVLMKKAVSRIMMLPLVPEELITPELVQLIIAASANGRSGLLREVKAFQAYVLNTYVGKRPSRSGPISSPRFPPPLWNVSGAVRRTNNAAESVHSQMNPDVNRMLSVYGFLSIVEKQMERTNERIAAGCKPETKAVEGVKNRLLAVELQKLVDGRQGIMNFLDNCGSIVQLKSEKEANAFVPRTISPVEDIEWKPVNKDRVTAAAQGLHRRLHPGSEMDDDDILKSVMTWAFQVPPEPDVRVTQAKPDYHLLTTAHESISSLSWNALKKNPVGRLTRVHNNSAT